MITPEIEDVDLVRMAADVRSIADDVEKGAFVAFAVVGCNLEGGSLQVCMVNPQMASHELLDEMAYEIKRTLFASFEAGA